MQAFTIHPRAPMPLAIALLIGMITAVPAATAAPPLQQEIKSAAEQTTPSEGADQAGATLEQRIDQMRKQLDAARQELGAALDEAGAGGSAGVWSADQLQERRRLLRTLVRAYQQQLDNLNRLSELRDSSTDLESRSSAWQGFDKKPPYPIDMVDGLRNDVLTKQRELDTARQRVALAEAEAKDATEGFKKSEQALRLAQEKAESADQSAEGTRARLELDMAQLRQRTDAARVAAATLQSKVGEENVGLLERELEFLQRKLSIASKSSPLTQADRDAKLAALAKERSAVEHETDKALEAEAIAQQRLQDTRDALRRLREMAADQKAQPDAYHDRITELQRVLETRQAVADTASQRVETLRLLLDALGAEQRIWEHRYETANTHDPNAIDSALTSTGDGAKRLNMWLDLLRSKVESTRALVENQKKHLDELAKGDPTRGDEQTKLTAYQERLDIYDRAVAKAEHIDRLLNRWRQELEGQRKAVPVSEQLTGLLDRGVAMLRALWDYELFAISDTITVEGREITGKRSITVGKSAVVLLLLTFGLWLSGVVSRRIYRFGIVNMGADVNRVTLFTRLLHILLFVALLLLALSLMHIPITVFAFLGGALAIAVGFGAQNLINNFISGLILLGERPIKVGDIVEVEGVRGRIVNVGGRCAQVRRFDGIDILVPNSSLLEKNVTNLTLSDQRIRIEVTVGVAYGSPVERCMDLIAQATREQPEVLAEPAPVVLFEEFGDNALVFTVYLWIEMSDVSDFRVVPSNVRRRIDELFADAGIVIAFPQRDVHLDATRPIPVQILGDGAGPAGK